MIPAAIYARFSSDNQDQRSIADQVADCRAYAERNGYRVVATFEDSAISGSVFDGRAGLQALLRDAATGRFKAVIVESTSRLSRNVGDRARLRELLKFYDCKLVTTVEGVVTAVVDGVKSVLDEQQLEDMKVHIRRGMKGVIGEGRAAGSKVYGYEVLPPEIVPGAKRPRRGLRRIDEAEAAVVRRIFAEYLTGRSAREIATRLNAERVPAPRGNAWRSSTIGGSTERRTGILQNEIYAGWLVWNRARNVRHPETERRLQRRNAPAEWQRVHVPALAIVDRTTFDAAQERRESRRALSPRDRAPARRILSGLIRCGCCGAGMPSVGSDASGIRIQCAGVKESGTCDHGRRYYLAPIERAVVGGLRARLASPQAVARYLEAMAAEHRRLTGTSAGVRTKLAARLAAAEGEIARAVDLALKGILTEAEAAARLPALRAERDRLAAELAAIADTRPVAIHPATLAAYRRDLEELDEILLNRALAQGNAEVGAVLRRMIDRVVVDRAPAGEPPAIHVHGYLEGLLDERPFVRWGGPIPSPGTMRPTEDLRAIPPRRGAFSFTCRAA